MSTKMRDHIFFREGGEMGKLIRNKDWSNTALGDPEAWPQSLKTMVGVMLENPFGMYIAWGKDYTQIYNDGYRPILGKTKHPKALGNSTRETFAEIWHIIGSMFQDVMEGKTFRYSDFELELDRNGFLEACFFDFAYSPIRLDTGEVGGVLVTVTETTPKKKAEAELKSRQRELEFVIEAAQLGTFDYNPLTNKFSANTRLKEWFGLPHSSTIELSSATDVIVEKDRQRVLKAIERALDYSLGGTYDEEYTIISPITKEKIILHAKGRTWFNQDKVAYRLTGTVEDVSNRVFARKNLEKSEQNIRALVESAPFPIGVYEGEEMRISLANQSIMDAWGKGNDVIGKLYADVLPELGHQEIFDQVRTVFETGAPFKAVNQRVEIEKGGTLKPYYFNYNFTPLLDETGKTYAVMNTAAEVTELHEARQKIEESEKRFRDAVMQAPLGIVILRGAEHVVEMANENYLKIVDKTEKEFVGKPLFNTLPEVKEAVVPIIEDIYTTGKAFYGYEFPVELNRQGKTELSYFNFVYHPIKEKNAITGIMVVATEVTATVKAKQLIEENEEKLKLIIKASELGIWDLNLKTQEMVASDRCYDILGFSNDKSLTQEKVITHVHPDDLKIRQEAFEKAFIEGTLHYQIRIIWEDNSVHWKDVKGKVFYDEDNQPERMLGTVRDITEERNFHQQLLDREEKFRLLADSMPQHIWTADPEGNLNYFNKSVYDFSGLTYEQIEKDGWLQIVHPDDREENLKEWHKSVKTGENFLMEHRFRKHDGEYRWQLSRAIPQKDANGVIKMWVGSSTDIQEQKVFTSKLEKMVNKRTKELEHKNLDLEKMNKELQSFVYISSHDLQEPLRKIQTFASRIKEKDLDTLSDRAKGYFNRMQMAAYRMQNLIQDLIAYSRTNVQEKNFEIYNLQDVIDDTKETLSEELEQKDVVFKLENICDVRIIPVQFKQVILNLLSNSIKFAKEGTPTMITISCDILKGGETNKAFLKKNVSYCHIRFSDNGIGFEQQYHNKIFDVFQRLHNKEDYSGTGIGLAIVKRIIENHEGFIFASSEINKGATFDIYLPEA